MSSKNAPLGLIIEEDENEELKYIEVPKSDYRSVKNSILDLENVNGQLSLNLVTTTDQLQLPAIHSKKSKSVEKPINKSLINSIPKSIGALKVTGTIYIPIIFVSLVLRKAKGHDFSYATELTAEVNEYISMNISRPKIARNNMSRELRKEKFLELPWLRHQENGRQPLFSLNEGWENYWESYFGKPAPKI